MAGRKIKILLITVFLLSLIPSILRVISFASDAYGLVIIASSPQKNWSLNPYSKDFMPLSPSLAIWILKNSDYPYSHCSSVSRDFGNCRISHIAWAGRALDNRQPVAERRGYELIEYFVSKGEPLNTKSDGLTPIHEAVLFNNPKYLELLLKAGADPLVKTDIDSRVGRALNAEEYLQLLDAKQPNERAEIHRVFNQYKNGFQQ